MLNNRQNFDLVKKIFYIAGLLFIASGCGGAPVIVPATNSSVAGGGGGGGGGTTGGGDGPVCTQNPVTDHITFSPESIRGANVVFVIDDSGSMSEEIDRVASNIGAFIDQLVADTADRFRMILLFSPTGATGNGSALNGSNPFTSQLNAHSDSLFHVNIGTGSRGADIALFKAFATSNFEQDFPSAVPTDHWGQLQSSCAGAGKYFRPRGYFPGQPGENSLSESGQTQTPASCWNTSGLSSIDGQGVIHGPLSYLTKGVASNIVFFGDDNLNINGSFADTSGEGYQLLSNMLSGIFSPLGTSTPSYYHSVVGLTGNNAPPADSVGTIERIGSQYLSLTSATNGLSADVRQASYSSVFDSLRTKILFSEQVFNLSCVVSNPASVVVKLRGAVLDPAYYRVSVGSTEIRILESAFSSADLGQSLSLEVTH